ncbi:Ig-like domain-containing protein, partial [Maribacter sp.]
MKTTHILGIFLIFNFFLLSAQDGLNISGANISITPGATIRIDKGDLRISGNAEVKNEAQISVDGNWLNNNTTGQIFTTDSEGIVTLTKTTDITTIGGTTTTLFYNLILDVDQVTLEVNTIVGGSVSGSNLGVLNLKDVSLNLNSNSLQISNSLIGAIITDEGYIISEDVLNQSKVLWQTSPTGAMYTVPFGTVSGAKIPLSIERAAGDLGQITVSTYPTGLNMTPFPTQPETVSSTETTNGSNLINKSINRFWQLDKTGAGTANLTFSYADAEVPSGGENDLSSYRFNTTLNKWESKGVSAIDIANNTVTVSGVNEFSPWTLGGGTPEDFDGDGIVNENDLDNDNDGILDADEGVCTPNQSGNWGGFTNNITYDYLDGVVVRITNAAAHLNLNNFNPAGAGFWSENLAGDPSALGSFDFGESVIISFEDAAGNPVKVTNPAIHFDRLGESDGTTQNSAEITLQDGLTWRKLGGTDDFITTTTTARDGGAGLTAALAAGGYSAESTQNDIDGTAAGSLQIQGVISTFTLTFPKAEPTTGTQDIIEMIIFACKQIDDDNDGTPNFLDVDSDGDGCPDAIEGGANHDYDDLDEYNSLTATVDATGVPGGTSQTLGTSQDKTQQSAECSECHPTHPSYVDSDNDTIGDFCDVDDDNDGILDTDEYGEIDCVDAITPLFGIAQGPNPINGSDPANPLVGNSFLYINVYSGIDAIIKIESSTDTEILDFDVSGSGIEDHFQPQITHSTGDGYTEFSIQFVLTGTSIPAPKTNYLVTAVDNDIREYIAFEDSVDEVYVDTPTDQDVYSGIGTNGGFSNAYVSNGVLENGIIVNTPNTHVSGLYPQTNKVIFRLGNTDGSISNHSIGFTPCIPQDFWNTPPTLIGAIDTDSDGITDDLDNDSDSDGCPDALEGNGTYTFTDIDGSGALTATPNANGLPGTAQGIGTSKDSSQKNGECDECNSGHPLFVDTDGDGYGDYCDDLDDDNDGILDTDECLVEHPIEWSHNADSGNSDFATYGSDNNQTMTSSFSAASNISFGAGLDESVNYSYTYILDDADQLTYANAKANNDYVEMSYTVANNVILKAIDGGFYTNGPSDPDATLGFFKIALEMSTSPTFGTSTLIFKDKQIGDLSVAPNYVSFSDNYSISLIAGTTYYFRYYLYDEQNSDATDNRVRFDDIRYRHDSGCDTDNDGTPDFQDNDSDGDGCPDALEGDGSNTYADLDSNLRLIAAVNGNGIPAGTSQGVGTSTDDTLQADECSPCDPSHPSYVDSDGDAIGDFCDLDDDNDGILDTVECAAVYYNDSFETPNLSIDTASPPNKPDGDLDGEIDLFINQTAIEGWTVSNGGTFDIIYDLFNANDGLQSIDLYGSPTASNIQKTYTGFTAGTTVDFSLDYSSAEAAFEASVYVNSGSGRTLVAILQPSSVATINGASGVGNRVSTVVWSTFSTQLTPTATSITIEIESSGLLGTGSTGVLIDNIILSQACNDTDGDGTTDDKDIDSDNDGCADAIEAGHLDDDNDGEVDGSGYDANGQVTGAITAYTGTINGVTTASETSIDTAPTDQEERVGDDAVFSVVASALDASAYASGTPTYDINANAGLTYQWQVSTNSGSTFSDIGGANSASLTVADVTLLMDGNIYKVLVSSANNSCPEEAQATLNVINNVDAIDDSAGITAIDGFFGATDILNVFDNDEFNGAVLNPASVTITPVTNGPLTVNTDGSVDIASNTGTGSYTVNYQICDATNSANCDIAIVTVNVGVNSLPTAQDDEVSVAQDTSNNSIDVLANNGNGPDSFGGDGPNTGAITLPSTTTTNGGTVSVDNNSTPLDPTDDTVLYTPAVGYSGADSFTYTITDANTDASTATVNVTVIPTPTISISVVALDDIVNATEDDSPVTISGTTTNVEDGQTVTVVLNGTTYSPTVLSNAWTFDISATEAQALDPTETITADVSNVAGNVAVQATRDIQHVVTTPIVTISVVAVDDIINATEDDSPVTISGTTTNVEDGQTVTVVLNGTTYSPTVLSNAWTFDITATEAQALDPTETITADVNNVAGNTAVQATRDIQHDAIAPIPVLEIDDITVDNILNATEAGADVAVTGTVSGDFNTGDTVTLTVDGTD